MASQTRLQTMSSVNDWNIEGVETYGTYPSNSQIQDEDENLENMIFQLIEFYNNIPSEYIQSFNYKFNALDNLFEIKDPIFVKLFLLGCDDLFEVFDVLYPVLQDYFPRNKYVLKLIENNENGDFKLALYIQVNYFPEDVSVFVKNLMKVNSEIRPLKRKLNLIGKFFIDLEGL
jgi:hypothetical protein